MELGYFINTRMEIKVCFNMLAGSPGGRSVIKAEDLPSADALSALFFARRIV